MILKIQDIAIFAARFSNLLKSVSHMKLSQISEIGTEKISSWTENISSWTGKTQKICKKDLSGDPAMYIFSNFSEYEIVTHTEISTGKISRWTDISSWTGKTEEIYKKNLSGDPSMYILPCPL